MEEFPPVPSATHQVNLLICPATEQVFAAREAEAHCASVTFVCMSGSSLRHSHLFQVPDGTWCSLAGTLYYVVCTVAGFAFRLRCYVPQTKRPSCMFLHCTWVPVYPLPGCMLILVLIVTPAKGHMPTRKITPAHTTEKSTRQSTRQTRTRKHKHTHARAHKHSHPPTHQHHQHSPGTREASERHPHNHGQHDRT